MSMSEPITLGYWGIRGRGQVIRLLLAFTGAQWTEKKYHSQGQWKGIGKDHASLGLNFPNLPYLLQGDFKLTESRAIINFIINISNKKQLLGRDFKDSTIIQNIVSVFAQIMGKCIELVFDVQNFDKRRPQIQQFVQTRLKSLQDFYKNKDFVLGYLTLADFIISQGSYYIQNIFPQTFERYSSLKLIRQTFENVEQIKAYYARQDSVKGPFLPPIGKIKF